MATDNVAVAPGGGQPALMVSDGEDVSTIELLRRMGQAMGKPARLLPVPPSWLKVAVGLLGKGDVAQRLCGSLQVDISKTRELLGGGASGVARRGVATGCGAWIATLCSQ